jgi:hypothetical protein
MTHWLAKIGGWAQFALTLIGTFANNQPHGWAQWVTALASGLAAVGIHAASSTDGTK